MPPAYTEFIGKKLFPYPKLAISLVPSAASHGVSGTFGCKSALIYTDIIFIIGSLL
jgi:hypothetical protein